MKKWIFVLGILGCSLLFFVSGTLVGYLTSEKLAHATETEEKPVRQPSKNLNPIIGKIVKYQTSRATGRATSRRSPTPNAVMQAEKYKMQLMGN